MGEWRSDSGSYRIICTSSCQLNKHGRNSFIPLNLTQCLALAALCPTDSELALGKKAAFSAQIH